MTSNPVKFEIVDIRLMSTRFELNKSFIPGNDVQITVNFSMEHGFIDESDLLHLTVGIDIKGDDAPMTIFAEFGGVFKMLNKHEAKSIGKIAEIHCAAILFPFIREFIADITRRSGLQPLHLQPVNFYDFYNKNHPEEEH